MAGHYVMVRRIVIATASDTGSDGIRDPERRENVAARKTTHPGSHVLAPPLSAQGTGS